LLIFEKRKDFDALGVGGRKVAKTNTRARIERNRVDLNKNIFIFDSQNLK
jgi:hypothetical protein